MCIGLHTLPPCLLFCGNYILHESEYDVHIFCVALDIIIYPPPLRPHFYQRYRFFDRLKHPVLSGCLLLFMLYFTRLRVCEISLFDLRSASAPYQCAIAVIQSELFINRRDVIHIDYIAPVTSEKA